MIFKINLLHLYNVYGYIKSLLIYVNRFFLRKISNKNISKWITKKE